MKILVTNDDGINSPGLWSVAKALQELGEVTVVAPDRDQSGIGAAMTLLSVVRAHEIAPPVEGIKTFSVEGTPGDCVILGAEKLANGPLDLVVSGINRGSNMGLDILLSGTVGGAFQGYFRNIPSIAVSVASLDNVQYEAAAQTTKALAQAISKNSLPRPLLLNVNLPNAALDKIERVEITRLGSRAFLASVNQGYDGRRAHYWLNHNRPTNHTIEEGTDAWAVQNNCISITPLDTIFSNHEPSPAFNVLAEGVVSGLGLGNHS